MKRYDIINSFIRKHYYKRYLEIGCQWGINFNEVKCRYKISIDPDPKSAAIYKITSDDFFAINKEMFDIIFIDGLHMEQQVDKDIVNSLKFLNENGTIVMHDCLPTTEQMQSETWNHTGAWTGTVWRSFVKMRMQRKDLEMYVIDTDYGCGVIRRGQQDLLKITNPLTYNEFKDNKKEWLNIKNIDNIDILVI